MSGSRLVVLKLKTSIASKGRIEVIFAVSCGSLLAGERKVGVGDGLDRTEREDKKPQCEAEIYSVYATKCS